MKFVVGDRVRVRDEIHAPPCRTGTVIHVHKNEPNVGAVSVLHDETPFTGAGLFQGDRIFNWGEEEVDYEGPFN